MRCRERGKLHSKKAAGTCEHMLKSTKLHLCQEAILQPRPCDESISTLFQTRDPSWVQDRNESGTVATNQLARPRACSICSCHVQCRTAGECGRVSPRLWDSVDKLHDRAWWKQHLGYQAVFSIHLQEEGKNKMKPEMMLEKHTKENSWNCDEIARQT